MESHWTIEGYCCFNQLESRRTFRLWAESLPKQKRTQSTANFVETTSHHRQNLVDPWNKKPGWNFERFRGELGQYGCVGLTVDLGRWNLLKKGKQVGEEHEGFLAPAFQRIKVAFDDRIGQMNGSMIWKLIPEAIVVGGQWKSLI